MLAVGDGDGVARAQRPRRVQPTQSLTYPRRCTSQFSLGASVVVGEVELRHQLSRSTPNTWPRLSRRQRGRSRRARDVTTLLRVKELGFCRRRPRLRRLVSSDVLLVKPKSTPCRPPSRRRGRVQPRQACSASAARQRTPSRARSAKTLGDNSEAASQTPRSSVHRERELHVPRQRLAHDRRLAGQAGVARRPPSRHARYTPLRAALPVGTFMRSYDPGGHHTGIAALLAGDGARAAALQEPRLELGQFGRRQGGAWRRRAREARAWSEAEERGAWPRTKVAISRPRDEAAPLNACGSAQEPPRRKHADLFAFHSDLCLPRLACERLRHVNIVRVGEGGQHMFLPWCRGGEPWGLAYENGIDVPSTSSYGGTQRGTHLHLHLYLSSRVRDATPPYHACDALKDCSG